MVTAETTVATAAWDDAVRRATAVAGSARPGGMDEDCWDDVAIRDIIATVLYALHLRGGAEVDAVPWSSVLWWLWDDERVIALVESTVPSAAQALDQPAEEPQDPVLARWRWLNRTWDPEAPTRTRNRPPAPWDALLSRHDGAITPAPEPEPRWEGMSRGIGNALPDPGIEICTSWAASAVASALSAERSSFAVHQRVRATAGDFAGQGGYVREIGWSSDDQAQQVTGPAGYVVDLDDADGTERIDAEHLEPAADHQWPRRPEGARKDGPPPGLTDPLPPTPSCADDLQELLARAGNPEAVPDQLRQTVRGALHHHHLSIRRLASPRPRRATVHLVLHWYQLTERYVDSPEGRADIWEVVVTEHLHDAEPTRLLAPNEQAAKALAEQHTGLVL